MVSLKTYSAITITSAVAAVWYAFNLKSQFYPAMIYLSVNKLNIVVLGNLAFWFILMCGSITRSIFLGQLTADEDNLVSENARYAITETCLALTIFREELNLKILFLFTSLLFVKGFHWLAQLRVDNLAREEGVSTWRHLRIASLLCFLVLVDAVMVASMLYIVINSDFRSTLFLFAFEYMILAVAAMSTFSKYLVVLIDIQLQGRWVNKSLFLFVAELLADTLRLFLYLLFFGIVCLNYGLPLHLIREVYMTFYTLRERVLKFLQYRRLVHNMNQRFPVATPEELARHDPTCIICREDMESARKIPGCGHLIHFWCLRRYLETSQRCPICLADIPLQANRHRHPVPAHPAPQPAPQAPIVQQPPPAPVATPSPPTSTPSPAAAPTASAPTSAATSTPTNSSPASASTVFPSIPFPATLSPLPPLPSSAASSASSPALAMPSFALPVGFPSFIPPLFVPQAPDSVRSEFHLALQQHQAALLQQHIQLVKLYLSQLEATYETQSAMIQMANLETRSPQQNSSN